MAWIGANHAHHPFAADDLAVPADAPYRSQNFHYLLLYVDVPPSRGFPSGSCVEIKNKKLKQVSSVLLGAEGDPRLGQIVGGQLHSDFVTGQDPDVVHPHLA